MGNDEVPRSDDAPQRWAGRRRRGQAWLELLVVLAGAVVLVAGYRLITASDPDAAVVGSNRPTNLMIPSSYQDGVPVPLLVVLHPYGGDGRSVLRYTDMEELVEGEGVMVVAPNGTVDQVGKRFWNATDACCNIDGSDVDDVAYLAELIDEITDSYTVDRDRIYLYGHSNGAFMAHRFACERPDLVAGIVAAAGAAPADLNDCGAVAPVHVLSIHGDADRVVAFTGGDQVLGIAGGGPYPAARATVAQWATRNRCTGRLVASGRADLAQPPAGEETVLMSYEGCPGGGAVELWVMKGASHVPNLRDDFPRRVWNWFAGHPKH